MPITRRGEPVAAPQPAGGGSGGGIRRRTPGSGPAAPYVPPPDVGADDRDEGMSLTTPEGLATASVAALAAFALKNPSSGPRIVQGLKRVGRELSALRFASMLSGLALPKSVLGNAGASVIASAERGTTRPMREFFSRQTLRDARDAWRSGGQVGPVAGLEAPGLTPTGTYAEKLNVAGRAMGALDVASRKAFMRAGLSADEAAAEILQAPLTGPRAALGEALDNPIMRYLVPFRRTPFNQFLEGGKVMKGKHPRILAATTGAGAVHGAATADSQYPASVGLGVAASARYGMPYALGAYAGRLLAGGNSRGALTEFSPVSEFGVEQSIGDFTRPFRQPAAIGALRRAGILETPDR